MKKDELDRFLEAQEQDYEVALREIKNGKKASHWMWYIFPQLKGLGRSHYAHFYGISGKNEAEAYLRHPVLGKRLLEISRALLELDTSSAYELMGSPDDMKLKSSMTLFASLANTDPVFEKVLQKFFKGNRDRKTLELMESGR